MTRKLHIFKRNIHEGMWPHQYEMLCGVIAGPAEVTYTTLAALELHRGSFASNDFCRDCLNTPEAGMAMLAGEE